MSDSTHQPPPSTIAPPRIVPPRISPPRVSPKFRSEHSVEEVGGTFYDPGQPTLDASSAARFIVDEATSPGSAEVLPRRSWWQHWSSWPLRAVGRLWDTACLFLLLAIVAGIPVLQFASLGYLLNSASNLADRQSWSRSLPGLRLAGKIGTFALLMFLAWLPVWLVTDLSYSAQLLQPGSRSATVWRVAAFAISAAWIIHIAWAAARGGRWWHFVWPAPLRFVTTAWRPRTWQFASDALYDFTTRLQLPRLWWLGLRAAVGAVLWTAVPVSMMIIGLRADEFQLTGLIGLVGALAMTWVMLYLPFLQIHMARENRLSAMLDVRAVRQSFLFAPLAHAFSLLALCLLCIPLYLLRIEATPAELLWAPSLVFVLFMLPAKLLLGAAMGFAASRRAAAEKSVRHWSLRWPARAIALASVLVYVGALYIAQLVAGQGAFVMYFQHAFLVPAPLISV